MTTRVLPVEEWPRLAATLAAPAWRDLDPQFAEVIVVERDGAIVGQVILLQVMHAECCENTGGPGVMRLLWECLQARVALAGGKAVWGAAVETPMRRLLERHGTAVPGDHFILRMPSCPLSS